MHFTYLSENPLLRSLNTTSKDPQILSWLNSQPDSYPSHCSVELDGRRVSVFWFKSQAPLGSSMSEHPWEPCQQGSCGPSEQRAQQTIFHHQILLSSPLLQGRAPSLDRSAGTTPRGHYRSQVPPSSCQAVSRPHLDVCKRWEYFHLSRYSEMLSSSDSSSNGNYMGANSHSYFPATSYSVFNSLEMQMFLQKK